MKGKTVNIGSYQLSKMIEVPIRNLDFHDEYIMMGSVHINCNYSKMCYNFVKNKTNESIRMQQFNPGQIFVNSITLKRVCQLLDDIYCGREDTQKNIISASFIDFYDGYILYNGRRMDCKKSLFKYNAFKKLSQIPNPHYRDGENFLLLNPLLEKLKECEELSAAPTIKAYFSEKIMQLGPNHGLRVEMSGDFSFLRDSYKWLPDTFVRQYIDKGCDLNELPLYILHVNSDSMVRVITPVLEKFIRSNAYEYLFNVGNLPDKKLGELFAEMKNEDYLKKYISKIQSSMQFSPVTVDNIFIGFTINITFDEWVQSGGCCMKENCSFKQEKANLLIELKQRKILMLSANKRRSALLFEYNTSNWQMVSYFLLSFFSSECRYKRSFLPISVLKAIGIYRITKVYKTNVVNSYISGKWFAVTNMNNKIQKRYHEELVSNQLID